MPVDGDIIAATPAIFGSNIFSIYGISIFGALVHNLTQLVLVNFLIVRRLELFYLLPVMALTAVVTGFIVAFVAKLILSKAYLFSN